MASRAESIDVDVDVDDAADVVDCDADFLLWTAPFISAQRFSFRKVF